MDILIGLLKSKTFWLNFVTLLATVLASDEITRFIDAETLVKIQAVFNIVLRLFTTKSIPEKGRV